MTVSKEILDALAQFPKEWVHHELWRRGHLEYLLRKDGQLRAYKAIRKWREENPGDPGPYVINAHRGFGKTALEIILCWEECLRNPNTTARYAPPDIRQGEDILAEILSTFLYKECPKSLRPHKSGNVYTFHNPAWKDKDATSRFIIVGCKEDADGQRGKRSNFVALDEIRDIRKPRYVVEDVFASHFIGKDRPFFLITSTPPKTIGHYFTKQLIPYAKRRGSYICIKGSNNTDFTDDERKKVLKVLMLESHEEAEDTPAYQREIECELIADKSVLACPEFDRESHLLKKYDPPSHFWPVTGVDFGHRDYNAVLAGIVDYSRAALVIREEFVSNSIATSELADGLKSCEMRAWGAEHSLPHPVQRWSDNNIQSIYDLIRDYGIPMTAVKKDWVREGKWAALNQLRDAFKHKRILVHENCDNLIHQLENAEINSARTDFVKADYAADMDPSSPILGHADALMALVYLWHMCKHLMTLDPFPHPGPGPGEFRKPDWVKSSEEVENSVEITNDTGHITGALYGDWRDRWRE